MSIFKKPPVTDVPAQFLPWLRPGAAYDKENILFRISEPDCVEPSVNKKLEQKPFSSTHIQYFGKHPFIADIANFIKVDPELFAHFLLTSPPAVRQFFDFDRETVLVYVYKVHETATVSQRKSGRVNDFKNGYSYLVALDSRNVKKTWSLDWKTIFWWFLSIFAYFKKTTPSRTFYDYDAENIRSVIEEADYSHSMLKNCKVLVNWVPSTIEHLRNCVNNRQYGDLFFTLSNIKKFNADFFELLERVKDIENSIICRYTGSNIVKKSWALATTLISRNPHISYDQLFCCFEKISNVAEFQKNICVILKLQYEDNIAEDDTKELYNQILQEQPAQSNTWNSPGAILPTQDFSNALNSQVKNPPPVKKQTIPSIPPPPLKLPVPKTMIHIPSGNLAFWQKVFDGYDVVIKQDEKSTVRVTTETGQKFTVQVIQPRQFSGISKVNEKDAQFELNRDRFVCQFCTTFLSVHSKKEGIVYCRCGEFKRTDFLPGQATCSSILSVLCKDSGLPHTKVLNRPIPKTVIRIPSGHLAFWKKVFDGDDVVIKEDEKSTVRVTTETGQKFSVQAIQPYQFSGISVFNKTDAQLEKDGVRFVCQFCRTFLNVHSEKEGIVYCRCGAFKKTYFLSANHNFESRKPKIPTDEMNILLIGASGAGKSTLINNIANLVKFKTQKEAYNGELTAVIPSRFVVGKSRDTLDVETIVVGQDLPEAENEDFNDFGQSITQRPRMCSITAELPSGETKKFNFIDTPGINDTRGLDQDDVNINYIKRAVLQAGYLHAICIVLLPNQSRMEADFESVLRRLLQFVPLEHRPNLVLFFTNTRGTLYRPGQTYPVLRKFAEAEPDLQIPLDQDRLFCFDSESYNFLCAHHHGIEYDLTGPKHYNDSWNASQKSLYRFFEFLDKVQPFLASEIGFLENASGLLVKCAKALQKFPNTNGLDNTATHLIGVLASSLNGEVKKARDIAQSIGFTEDIKLQRIQQLAFFRQLTRIDGLLSDTLQEKVQNFCDLYEPHFRFNNE